MALQSIMFCGGCSKIWRFEFNLSETVEVTFGESVRAYNSLKNNQQWQLNDCAIKVQQSCEHVGEVSCGIRPGGLNPTCGANLWHTVGLARMLYSCELWNISEMNLHILEVTNRYTEKRIQWLCSTTRSKAGTGGMEM